MRRAAAALLLLAALLGACGGDDDFAPRATIDVWILENQPERVRAARENVARFTARTDIAVRIVPIGDDALVPTVRRARRAGRLPDVMQLPMDSVHAYARSGLLDIDAAEDVVQRLGDPTFSQTALRLVSREGRTAAVPSDGWGQLLIYRADLFTGAGLRAPRTLDDVVRAARRLDRGGMAGITLATTPGESFTAETFEHIALIAGCRLVDDTGAVALDSAACRRAFRIYAELARHSPGGVQDVDSTRDAYFAGRAAMIFWSPFLLDAMAGLRDEAIPTCPECRTDRAYLARNSGLAGALSGGDAPAAQFGDISSWGIVAGEQRDEAERFVEYMMSDGYVRWLALSPQGKYPVRIGDDLDAGRFTREWGRLLSGVERRAPLRRFYSAESIEALGDGVRMFQRWGFEQGQAALVGALRERQPVTHALAAVTRGERTPEAAAREAQAAVERIQASIG
jgi:multiple sugar transport system substrate-binding protein